MGQMYLISAGEELEALPAARSGRWVEEGAGMLSVSDFAGLEGEVIFWIASRNWLSESSMNCPEVTTRSPSRKPLMDLVLISLGACAQDDGARFKMAIVESHENGVFLAAPQDRHIGHQQR